MIRARGLRCSALFTSIYQYVTYFTNGNTTFSMAFSTGGNVVLSSGLSLLSATCSDGTSTLLRSRCNYMLSIAGWNRLPPAIFGISVTHIIFISMLEPDMVPQISATIANRWTGGNSQNQGEVYLSLGNGSVTINFNPAGPSSGNWGADNNRHYFNVSLMRIG